MGLGEEILFFRTEDAENLVRFAKKHTCSASRRVLTSIHSEMNLQGTIHQFIEFTREEEHPDATSVPSEARALRSEARDEMNHRLEIFGEFLTRHPVGDRVDQGDEWDRLQQLTLPDPRQPITLSAEDEAFLRDRYLLLVLLQENGLVETKDGGMFLKGSMNPGEAVTQYPADLLMEPESSDLAAHGLTRLVTTYSETTYPVILGPESVLMIELEELEEFCQTCEVDEESLARALMNLALKKMIVDRIILFLRDQKKTTKEEILTYMKDFDLAIPDTVDHFSFHLHTTFIDEILDDLRKMRTIQGKDAKIRYTGG